MKQLVPIKKLSALLEVSQALGSPLDIRATIEKVLEILDRGLGMRRGAIALFEAGRKDELSIQFSYGLSEGERRRGRYRPDEGITGRVVSTGKPVIVPRVSQEPLFLNRTRQTLSAEESFICVPIKDRRKTIGALSIIYPFEADRNFDDSVKVLAIVASMISQSLRLSQMVQREKAQLVDENASLKRELQQKYEFRNIVGTGKEIRDVFEQIAQVADSNTTVLIRGESGTGKELVARSIYHHGPRNQKPFLAINCAAIPESLLESELFGHERGAFSGADKRRIGKFEQVHGGTLFLDEIGDMTPATQAKILRVLQDQKFERIGGNETIEVDVRIIAATNRDLEKMTSSGAFREDLYYRLNGFMIRLPPLRERMGDLPLLCQYFAQQFAAKLNKPVPSLAKETLERLEAHHWPGNIRELQAAIRFAIIQSFGPTLLPESLPARFQTTLARETSSSEVSLESFFEKRVLALLESGVEDIYWKLLEQFDQAVLDCVMRHVKGNQVQASQLLGLSRNTLRSKLAQQARGNPPKNLP